MEIQLLLTYMFLSTTSILNILSCIHNNAFSLVLLLSYKNNVVIKHTLVFMHSATYILSDIKFHENPSSESQADTCRQMDRQTRKGSKTFCTRWLMCPKNEITLDKLSSPLHYRMVFLK